MNIWTFICSMDFCQSVGVSFGGKLMWKTDQTETDGFWGSLLVTNR